MSCPDELTLDLWLADALTTADASTIAAHVASCATCTAQLEEWQTADANLRASLHLDTDERTYLAGLDLPKVWRIRSASATGSFLGRLALFIVVAGFVTWTVAAQPFDFLLSTLSIVGASTLLLTTGLGFLVRVGQVLIDLSLNPALGLSQPLLAMLALGLLFWPRLKSATHYLQGVRS